MPHVVVVVSVIALAACGDVTAPRSTPDSADCGAGALFADGDGTISPGQLAWSDLQDALAFGQASLLPDLAQGTRGAAFVRALKGLTTDVPPAPQATCNALSTASLAWQSLVVTPEGAPEREALRLVLQLFLPYTTYAP